MSFLGAVFLHWRWVTVQFVFEKSNKHLNNLNIGLHATNFNICNACAISKQMYVGVIHQIN